MPIITSKASSGGSSSAHAAVLATHDDLTSGGVLNWQATDFDSDHYVAGNGSGFVIPAGLGGAYLVTASLAFIWSTIPDWVSVILDFTPEPLLYSPQHVANPSSSYPSASGPSAGGFGVPITAMGQFSAGDALKVRPQWSGGTGVGLSANYVSQFGVTYLGPLT